MEKEASHEGLASIWLRSVLGLELGWIRQRGYVGKGKVGTPEVEKRQKVVGVDAVLGTGSGTGREAHRPHAILYRPPSQSILPRDTEA